MMLAAPAIISTTAQQQQPEWQSQYAVGLNKLDPHTYVWPYAANSEGIHLLHLLHIYSKRDRIIIRQIGRASCRERV